MLRMIQICAMARLLDRAGFAFIDFGQYIEYKSTFGAKVGIFLDGGSKCRGNLRVMCSMFKKLSACQIVFEVLSCACV